MPLKDLIKRKEYTKEYYFKTKEKNKEKNSLRAKEWYLKNKEKCSLNSKKWYEKNKEIKLKKSKEWVEKNKERHKQLLKNWYQKNKKHVSVERKKRYEIDPNFKMRSNISRRILLALKGKCKSANTMKLLGANVEQVWKHLESTFKPGMTKENHGEWHVDHIRPCSSFDLSKPEEQSKCFHYTNLQPLWAKENISKSDKIL